MNFPSGLRLAATVLACFLICTQSALALKSNEARRLIAGYTFITYDYSWNSDSGQVLQIWRGKKKLLDRRAHGIWIFSLDKQELSSEIKPGDRVVVRDLTGDGIIDVITQEWSGGAHCCYTFDVYSLGASLRHIWHQAAGNGHLHVDIPKRGLPRLEVENDTEHNRTGAALSDMPLDIYQWKNGGMRRIRHNVPHHRAD